MTGKQLIAALGITRAQLNAWIDEGLPWTGNTARRQFDADQVAAWLVAQGYAEPAEPAAPAVGSSQQAAGGGRQAGQTTQPAEISQQPIARTRNEVAQHFGVADRTVAVWITQGMPGIVGTPGRRDGYFPLDEIALWRAERLPLASAPLDDPRVAEEARLKRARASIVELDLAEKQGRLIDAGIAMREWIRAVAEAKTQADQLPAWLAKKLPESVDRDTRRELRKALKRRLTELYRTLQMGLLAQAEQLEQGSGIGGQRLGEESEADHGSNHPQSPPQPPTTDP